jgi:hypothetical protein
LGFARGPARDPAGQTPGIRSGYGIFYAYPDTNLVNNTVQSVPFNQTQTNFNDRPPLTPSLTFGNFFQGQPIVSANPNPGQPCPFGFVALSCSATGVTGGPVYLRNTYVQQWNLSVQRQLTPNLALDVAYVGNKTTRLSQFVQRNDPPPGPGAIQNRRPYPQWGAVRSVEYGGFGTYNSLQVKLESREWHGSSFLVSYTYSKCLDNGSSESTSTAILIPINKAVCDFSIPHLVASYTSASCRSWRAFHSMPLSERLAGRWNVSGITRAEGSPFTPIISADQPIRRGSRGPI